MYLNNPLWLSFNIDKVKFLEVTLLSGQRILKEHFQTVNCEVYQVVGSARFLIKYVCKSPNKSAA